VHTKDKDLEEAEDCKAGVKAIWPLWKLILMAVPQMGVQVMWCFVGPNAAPYMIHLGVGPALATLNNIAGPTTGFFCGPIIGAWSDSLTSKYGRRRPIIVVGLAATWIAGILFSASGHIFSGTTAIAFAVPLYWTLDVTINILQTPHRALVSDLASAEQQVPMQVVFVVMMAVGNFIGYSIMKIWTVPVAHMLEYMIMICIFNTICIGIQFAVARETPLEAKEGQSSGCCSSVVTIVRSVRGMPRLLYHLALVQCLVWIGNTSWSYYGAQWFANSVYDGDVHAPAGSPERIAYGKGIAAFSLGGQLRSGLQLLSALAIIMALLYTQMRPRLIYAPCIFIGATVSLLAAFAVGHQGAFAILCWAFSIMPETGSFAIPFGLVATLNKRAEAEGKTVSTALQMALLNCCVTVGQEICHLVLSLIEGNLELKQALPCVFILAGVAHCLGGASALCLDDTPEAPKSQEAAVQSI
jgi:Na+/melibiose symporter-like transporter